MALRVEEAETALIESVCSRLHDHIAPERVDRCEAFVRQFFHRVPPGDLAERSPRDLFGAAMAVWDFAGYRAPGSASVRAYNPGLAEHGWWSTNTIVEVVTDHMPFLVDSVGMELSRRGYGIQLSIHPVIDVLRDANPTRGRVSGASPSRHPRRRSPEIAKQPPRANPRSIVSGSGGAQRTLGSQTVAPSHPQRDATRPDALFCCQAESISASPRQCRSRWLIDCAGPGALRVHAPSGVVPPQPFQHLQHRRVPGDVSTGPSLKSRDRAGARRLGRYLVLLELHARIVTAFEILRHAGQHVTLRQLAPPADDCFEAKQHR